MTSLDKTANTEIGEPVKRWKPDGATLYECDAQGTFIPVAVPISAVGGRIGQTVPARRIKFFDSANSNLVDGKDYDALIEQRDRLVKLLLAVEADTYEISCHDVDGENWFDARSAVLASSGEQKP